MPVPPSTSLSSGQRYHLEPGFPALVTHGGKVKWWTTDKARSNYNLKGEAGCGGQCRVPTAVKAELQAAARGGGFSLDLDEGLDISL